MNPNPQATAARGERPQLFGAPSRGKGHADFGPSILATIDAGSSRSTRKPSGSSGRRIGLIGLFLLLTAGAYVAMRFSLAPAPVRVAAIPPAAVAPMARPAPVVAPPVPAASQGAASIETVPAPAAQAASAALAGAASASAPTVSVVASVDNIRETLARSEPAAKAPEPPARKAEPRPTQVARVEPVKLRGSTAGAKAPSRSERDEDAALLAAMLPHLRSTIEGPTSPAFEKRCGALNGDALAECRIKFCNGRQGDDGACPAAGAGGR